MKERDNGKRQIMKINQEHMQTEEEERQRENIGDG
jgi:hypothetical protein